MSNVRGYGVTGRNLFQTLPEADLRPYVFSKLIEYSLNDGSFQNLRAINKEFARLSKDIRGDQLMAYLKKESLIKFLQTNNITNVHTLKKGIYDGLMCNPNNQLIPQKYILNDLRPILLNKGTPYKIFSTNVAFCAVLDNGTVHTWGDQLYGGQQANIPEGRKVKSVFSTNYAFCAILDDGTVHTWGNQRHGGQQANIPQGRKVKSVFSTWSAFCAVLDNGTVHTWGDQNSGGQQPTLPNSSRIASW